MPKERPNSGKIPAGSTPEDELASLNAELRQKGPQANRRMVEATIETTAKKRRQSEKPASSGYKKT